MSDRATLVDSREKPLPVANNRDAISDSSRRGTQDQQADLGIFLENGTGSSSALPKQMVQDVAAESSSSIAPKLDSATVSNVPPSIHKRRLKQKPKGILKPAPPPSKAFSFRRDILQQLNTRLAQQGVNVQVPVPQGPSALGSLTGTAQGTAQAAGSILNGMFKRMSGFASAPFNEDNQTSDFSGGRSITSSGMPDTVSPIDRGREQTMRSNSTLANNRANEQRDSSSPTRSNNLPAPSSSIRPLRKVCFTVSNMAVIYPISNTIAPGDEDETRKRVEREHRIKLKSKEPKDWTVDELEKLYRDCCRMREEHPLKKMRSVFQEASLQSPPNLRTIDLSFIILDRQAIEPVADLLSVDFGLNKLVLENCGLTDDGLKSILHSLLASGSLPSLSLASNRKIKYYGWRYVGIFMRRAKALKYLDLSENNINKASLEHIAGAIAKQQGDAKRPKEARSALSLEQDSDEEAAPLIRRSKLLMEHSDDISSLTSLRLENCGLRSSSLELLAHSVRSSDLNHLSLRRNRIGQMGAVALAIMIKDYPDAQNVTDQSGPESSIPEMPQQSQQQSLQSQPQYAIRGSAARRSLSPALPDVPLITSSPGGGVTRRSMPVVAAGTSTDTSRELSSGLASSALSDLDSTILKVDQSLSESERDQVKQLKQDGRRSEEDALSLFYAKRARRILSTLPRVGNLLTLDLKGNDIRGGVAYLSQALKKNRTLKVLNLSDNNIEMSGLIAIADALKYNATLETLDLSHNPCCGPGLEGITTLRNAFTLNSNLKRLFISDTDLSSEGAIALAEFLPEAKSLIHLDLTENLQIDIAGVMALAVSVRMNKSLRCMDLNIPPNAPDFARLSQEILNSCIRNTEYAQRRAQQRGVKAPIAAPIYKSTLARAAKEKEERNRLMEANSQLEQAARTNSASSGSSVNQEKVVDAASECCLVLHELLEREEDKKKELIKERGSKVDVIHQSELAHDLLTQGRILRDKLQQALGVMGDGDKLIRALQVNDDLEGVISKLETLYSVPAIGLESEVGNGSLDDNMRSDVDVNRLQAPLSASQASPSSPTFSIGSDEEDDDEDDSSRRTRTKVTAQDLSDREAASKDVPLQQAAREVPSEKESDKFEDGNQKVNNKARGQLSEEGEIFRRAKSLHLNDEEEEPNGVHGNVASNLFLSKSGTEEAKSNHKNKTETEEEGQEVSGEELRRELLESDVPRTSPSRNVNDEAEQSLQSTAAE